MLRDEKVRGLATEFAGNWLAFRRFEEHNAVDRQRFPSFTGELRQAMYEEPIRFFVDLVSQNRSVLELLYAQLHLREPHSGQVLRHGRAADWAPMSGPVSTMRAVSDAGASCRCRFS